MAGYFWQIVINNAFVMLIYATAGILVLRITKSELAVWAPWGVFALHCLKILYDLAYTASATGWLMPLALTLPHGCLEIPALALSCWTGSELVRGRRQFAVALLCLALMVAGAAVETWVTPAPFLAWQ